jgi:hypothetical protein
VAYYISVGRFEKLNGTMGARGWHIWRTKDVVNVRWGPIGVQGRYPTRFLRAANPTAQGAKRTVEAAEKEVKRRIQEKEGERRANGDRAYQKLPRGSRIFSHPTWGLEIGGAGMK